MSNEPRRDGGDDNLKDNSRLQKNKHGIKLDIKEI